MKKPFLFKKLQRVYAYSAITQKRLAGTVIVRYRYKSPSMGTYANVYVIRMDDLYHSQLHECTISFATWAEDYLTSFKVLGESPAFAKA